MKKTRLLLGSIVAFAITCMCLSSCNFSSVSTSSSETEKIDKTRDTPAADDTEDDESDDTEDDENTGTTELVSQDSITVNAISVSLDENFIRGFDASEVDFYETEKSISWRDTDGTTKDFFAILKNHGINTVRLRIWNDPTQFSSTVNTGMNDLDRTISMAKRVKEAGLDLMLDFHYSDTWADPGRQIVPAAWKELESASDVASALSAYTSSVLEAVQSQAGITPKYVQVGNEINSGMLLATGGTSTSDNTATGTFAYAGGCADPATNLVSYLSAGADAVHNFDSSIKVVIHLASTGSDLSWFFKRISSVNYDIIGISYYPWESGHGTISDLKNNISTLKGTFSKDVMVVECSSHWKDESSKSAQNYTYQHMIDPSTASVYSDLETAISGSTSYIKGSVQNQANVIRHIIEETAASGGIGVFAWGGDLYGNYKWGMFDSSAVALSSLDVFNVTGTSSEDTDSLEFPYEEDVTGTGANALLLQADAFSSISGGTVTVSFVWKSSADGAGSGGPSCGAGSSWPTVNWADSVGTATFSGESLSALKENGLTVWIPDGVTYTITVSYSS
ncbi:MAG: glycosyl hydrolase 53 family protein [Treponema sp.]|nr:glycosyl hydrolase 53 family protein [Treponema sp.]